MSVRPSARRVRNSTNDTGMCHEQWTDRRGRISCRDVNEAKEE